MAVATLTSTTGLETTTLKHPVWNLAAMFSLSHTQCDK